MQIMEDEEDGIGITKALAILSAHEHRDTPQWRLIEEQRFKNGRLGEALIYVESIYEKPHEMFEPVRLMVFEAEAIAKSYVMENIENAVRSIQDEDNDED